MIKQDLETIDEDPEEATATEARLREQYKNDLTALEQNLQAL